MYSLAKNYEVRTGTFFRNVVVTSVRMANDIDGNPRYKTQVWLQDMLSDNATLWTPKVKGFRRTKDDSYILKSVYNLEESVREFVKVFEESVND
jgi:hypothetical protein